MKVKDIKINHDVLTNEQSYNGDLYLFMSNPIFGQFQLSVVRQLDNVKFNDIQLSYIDDVLIVNTRFVDAVIESDSNISYDSFIIYNKVNDNIICHGKLDRPIHISNDYIYNITLSFDDDIVDDEDYRLNDKLVIIRSKSSIDSVQNVNIESNYKLYNSYNSDYYNTDKNNSRYSDISLNGNFNPITGDISLVKDDYSINQSLRNLLLSNTYERPFSSQFIASDLQSLLFEMNDEVSGAEAERMVANVIQNHEPRILVQEITVFNDVERYGLSIDITYMIKDTNEVGQFRTLVERL